MKPNNSIIVLGVALAVVAGMFTANVTGLMVSRQVSDNINTSALITGHVETIVRDADGNVKAYRQSDNLITNIGETCAAKLLFHDDGSGTAQGAATTTGTCRGATQQPWTVIAIGTGTAIANGTDNDLGTEVTDSGLTRGLPQAAVTFTNSSGTGSSSSATVVLERLFTNNGSVSRTISESGLFNDTTKSSTDSMFARQVFTGIPVNVGDSLTVRWTINIGGTSNALQQFS